MKKTVLKVSAFSVAIALILCVLMFANSLVGNPISKALAQNTAEKHLAEAYPDTDYSLDEVSYCFKDGYYHAYISSESSIDTQFTLLINGFGKLKYDDFDYNVTSGWATASRIDLDYRNTVDKFFDSVSFPYDVHIGYGELTFVTAEYKDEPITPDYAIVTDELTIDAYYNACEFGKRAGKITVYIADSDVCVERMAEVLLDIRESFDSAGIGFYVIDCVLEYPQTEGAEYVYGKVEVIDFLYSDIYEDGLVERVSVANDAASEYYGMMDKELAE